MIYVLFFRLFLYSHRCTNISYVKWITLLLLNMISKWYLPGKPHEAKGSSFAIAASNVPFDEFSVGLGWGKENGVRITITHRDENINFALDTHAIAQMKGLLILIKSYKKHICQKWIFDPLLVPRRLKRARKSWN